MSGQGEKRREEAAAWWALVEGACAALVSTSHCCGDDDAVDAAINAASHYRNAARMLWNHQIVEGSQA